MDWRRSRLNRSTTGWLTVKQPFTPRRGAGCDPTCLVPSDVGAPRSRHSAAPAENASAELAWLQEGLNSLPWPPEEGEAAAATDALRAPRLDAVVEEPIALAGVLVPAGSGGAGRSSIERITRTRRSVATLNNSSH